MVGGDGAGGAACDTRRLFRDRHAPRPATPKGSAHENRGAQGRGVARDKFRFAPPLTQSPFVPAKAGTRGPRTLPKYWVPASAGTNGIERRLKLSSRPRRRYLRAVRPITADMPPCEVPSCSS